MDRISELLDRMKEKYGIIEPLSYFDSDFGSRVPSVISFMRKNLSFGMLTSKLSNSQSGNFPLLNLVSTEELGEYKRKTTY